VHGPTLVHGTPHQKSAFLKSSKSNYNTTNMANIEAALADLTLQDKPNIQATADKYRVNRLTLSRRFNKVTTSRENAYDQQRVLNNIQSKELIKYINELTKRGLPSTTVMVHNLAAGIIGRQPGKHWTARWLAAHKDELKTGYLSPINAARKKADSALYYSLYFKLIGRKLSKYNIQPQNMYNMDEKGFLIGFLKKSRRIFSKAAFTSGRVKHVN